MSGVFNGDSIYKSGGGGGGFKDGGQLVDGDFIEVKNNTVSSYDNVSRDPVNFYFEVKDGDVLNSVVELTTAVNATVNVYVLKNGLYYLLGNVGGNTVNAGDDYKVNITGNSYSLEVVTTSTNIPEYVNIKNGIYKCAKFGSQLVMLQDLKEVFKSFVEYSGAVVGKPTAGYNTVKINDDFYYRINDSSTNSYSVTKDEINQFFYPWRLPLNTDYFINNLDASEKAKFNGSLGGYVLCESNDNLSINNPSRDSGSIAYGFFYTPVGGQTQILQNISPSSGFGINRRQLVKLRLVMDL